MLAGCGGGGRSVPLLAHDDAAALIDLSHRIAGEGACAQAHDIPRLRSRAVALVNAHRVPPELQDTLISGVNALGALQPVCLPTVEQQPTTTVSFPPAPVPPAHGRGPKPKPKPKPKPHGPDHHGHGHGPGKKKH